MEHKTEITVRHYECDAYGHVNNANYLNYLEHARSEYLRSIGFNYKGFMAEGYGLYVAKVTIKYNNPALPEEILDIFTKPIKRKRASGIFLQQVKRGETLLCEAEVTWASIGQDGKMCVIPKKWDVDGLNCE